jgi:hypothetical protein
MFKLSITDPEDFYENCYSEYFTEKYPKNFFDAYIDIGACGIISKWHINHMGNDNPLTKCIGFEPEEKSFNIINNECKDLKNVFLEKLFFGKEISLSDTIKKYQIDINKKWCFSCDCEGDEKYLFNNLDELNILKNATHISFELHPKHANITFDDFIEKIKNNFNDTHKIVITFLGTNINNKNYHLNCGSNNFSIIMVKKEIFDIYLKEKLKNLKYNFNNKLNCMVDMNGRIRKDHSIVYLN